MKKIYIVLILLLVIPFILNCKSNSSNNSNANNGNDEPSYQEDSNDGNPLSYGSFSYNYEDYIGDIETFVYGLIFNELGYSYYVFPGFVELSTTECVYGLGYTDFSDCYTNDDETVAYFMSGFIPFIDELKISEEEFDNCLIINNLDYQDSESIFVWKYKSEEFSEHCVAFGQYITYGVDKTGTIFYNKTDYKRGVCDEELGSLYSYDESRYVFDVDFGNYVPITGVSSSITIDYLSIQKEIEEYIAKQDFNYFSIETESIVYNAQDLVTSYLLSLQEESFLGFSIDELIDAISILDPSECIRITPGGLKIIDIEPIPPAQPTALTKWLVGMSSGILAAAGIIGQIIFVECPALSALSGAVAGAAIKIFMEVVVSNKTLGDVDWRKVGVAAAAGAVSGFVGPYIQALSGASYFFVDSIVDGVIGGIEEGVCALLDGKSWGEAAEAFGWGAVCGFAISAGLKGIGAAISAASRGIANGVEKLSSKLSSKTKSIISKITEPISKFKNGISGTLNKLKQKADSSIFHSKFVGKRLFAKNLNNLIKNDSSMPKQFQKYLSNDNLFDIEGNKIDKDALYDIFKKANNGENVGKYIIEGESVFVKKVNGVPGIFFDDSKYLSVAIEEGLTTRTINLNKASEKVRRIWLEDTSKIPDDIKALLIEKYPNNTLEEILTNKVATNALNTQIIAKSNWTLHECTDLKTVQLVPKLLHDKTNGIGISHAGGVSLYKYIKSHMGSIYFETFISAAASGLAAN